MLAKRAAAWAYGTSALIAPLIFWLFADSGSSFLAFILIYELVPFGVVGLLLAATRRDTRSGAWLELATAGLWCLMCLAVALWHPLVNTIQRMGAPLIDAIAVVVGCTAAALIGLGAKALGVAWSRGAPDRARSFLEALATGLLGLYLARMGLRLYSSTRVTLSGGLAGYVQELTLRVAVFGIVALLLAASLGVALYQWRMSALAEAEDSTPR